VVVVSARRLVYFLATRWITIVRVRRLARATPGAAMTTLRGLLAVALLTGVYLIASCLLLLLGGMIAGGASLMYAYASGASDNPAVAIALLLGCVPVLMAILGGLFAVRRVTRPQLRGLPVWPADAPKLWQLVDELAEQVGTSAPAEIMLTTEVNAAVTENTRLLGLLPGHRCLYLGIPLLAGLSLPELRALLGHELGHYAGKHTRLTALIYRGYLAMDGITENLRATNPSSPGGTRGWSALAQRLFTGYANTYARLSYAVRRRQELEADRTAVRLAGREAAADALRAVYALRPIWLEFEADHLGPSLAAGRLPADPVAAFAALLESTDCGDAFRELKAAEPQDPPQRPFDSHPGLAARLRNLDRCADVDLSVVAADRPPSRWRWTDLDSLFTDHLDRTRPVEVASWLRLVAMLRAPTPPVRELLGATTDLAGAQANLDTVLDLLAANRSRELAHILAGDVDEDEALRRLRDMLFQVLAHALVGAGCGHWRLRWARPSELILDELRESGVRSTDSTRLADAALGAIEHPAEVDRLRFQLIMLGFNPAAEIAVERPERRTLAARPGTVEQERRDRRSVVLSGVISLAVVAVVLLFGFGQRASMSPPGPIDPSINLIPGPSPLTALLPPSFAIPPDLTSRITVRNGDTLNRIASCYDTTVTKLRQENNLGDSTQLHSGQTLVVPLQFAPPKC
jgi:Zn-dependent protease with chaperone function